MFFFIHLHFLNLPYTMLTGSIWQKAWNLCVDSLLSKVLTEFLKKTNQLRNCSLFRNSEFLLHVTDMIDLLLNILREIKREILVTSHLNFFHALLRSLTKHEAMLVCNSCLGSHLSLCNTQNLPSDLTKPWKTCESSAMFGIVLRELEAMWWCCKTNFLMNL